MGYTTAIGYTPTFSISKGGEEITSGFADRLLSIKIESYEGDGQSDSVEIRIDDRDWIIAEPSFGEGSVTVGVSLGYKEGGLYEMGTFEIMQLSHDWSTSGKTMILTGSSSGANTSLKAPAIIGHEDKTLGEIVSGIAQSANVTAAIDPSLAGIKIPFLHQNSSAGHLLNELERRYNGLAKFQDGYLSFTKRGTGLSASDLAFDVTTLSPEDAIPGKITSNSFHAYSKVRASYWDAYKNEPVWLQSTVAGSPNSTIPFLIKRGFATKSEAQAAADAQMGRLNRSTKQGTVTLAKGCPEIRGGMKIVLSGFRSGVDDTYMVRCATHTLTKDAGLGTVLDLYTEDGAGDDDSATGDEAPTTAPTLDEMTAGTSTVSLGQGGIGHQ